MYFLHTFVREMTRLLKYLLSFIVAAAFWSGADVQTHAASAEVADGHFLNEAINATSISASEAELCVPRQVSFANTQQVQSTARRTTSIQRNNLEFAKSGKVINAGVKYFIQRISIITHSSLVKPGYRLLCLGKLII